MALPFLFEFWAMEHQLPPEGDWRSWVILGGRGAGKTRAGSEWVRAQVEGTLPLTPGRARRVALVGETIEQVREVMIFGDSGILAGSPPDRRPDWESTRKRLVWPNGAIATVHSAHDPEGLRGPQFDAAWVDELGCAAVDKGTNQPNKFVDPKSSESSLPYYSTGARDDLIQMQYLRAMISYWTDPTNNPISDAYAGQMINMDRAFVWAWDARPYPHFPNVTALWSDGTNYARGHWLNGRMSARSLDSVVAEICRKAGVKAFDVSRLYGFVRGYVVSDVSDARSALQPLMLRFGFDAIERDGQLLFKMRDGSNAAPLSLEDFAISSDLDARVEQSRSSLAEMAGRVRLKFVQADGDFDIQSEEVVLADEKTHSVSTSEIPIVMTRTESRQTVERWLVEARIARDSVRFALPPSKMDLGAGDVVELLGEKGDSTGLFRIDRVEQGALQIVEAVRVEPQVYVASDLSEVPISMAPFVPAAPVLPLFLDLPLMTGDEISHSPHIAVTAKPWPGSVAVYQSLTESDFQLDRILTSRSVIGVTETEMNNSRSGILDHGAPLQVRLTDGTLSSVEMDALLAGQNLAAIGDGSPGHWEIFQFSTAELVGIRTYQLSSRLRGQLGTESFAAEGWPVGSWFVLLDGTPEQIGLTRNQRRLMKTYRIGPARRPLDDQSFVHKQYAFDGNGLRPYTPVHLSAVSEVDGSLSVSWIRRGRIDADTWDVMEIPLGEDAELYAIRIIKDGVVLREISWSNTNWTYAIADQISDGAAIPFEISIAQVSAGYGLGPAAVFVVAS